MWDNRGGKVEKTVVDKGDDRGGTNEQTIRDTT